MTRDDIRAAIYANLVRLEGDASRDEVRLQSDPYGGWQLAVVSNRFQGLARSDRRQMCLTGLEAIELEWAEFLTPDEREWAGPLPGDIAPQDLPLWPESLAKSTAESAPEVVFASDLDDDLPPPIVATFYSLRGGVGRSTALAYTARVLAANRRKVLCVDMDLEAPGLATLLGCADGGGPDRGVVDLLIQLDQGGDPDFSAHILPAAHSDDLFVVPAGMPSADYARKLGLITPSAWYREERNPLRLLLEGFKRKLPFVPDVILLDARTGITDLSGPLLFDLADIAILVFFPHPQARRGTELLAHALFRTTTSRERPQKLAPEVRFLISPIPASKANEVVVRYETRPLEWITEWLTETNSARPDDPIVAEEVTHFIRYREDIATSDSVGIDPDVSRIFQPVADWIERFLPTRAEIASSSAAGRPKSRILKELAFSTGTAESQTNLLGAFVETENIVAARDPEVPLVLGRKGTGKTALFRYLSESKAIRAIVVHGPAPLLTDKRWALSNDGFKEIGKLIDDTDLTWREFWMLYTCIAIEKSGCNVVRPDFLGGAPFAIQEDVVTGFQKLTEAPRANLKLADWLSAADVAVAERTMLLFDGLDTGFGNATDDRDRRKASIEGLFSAWMDRGQALRNLRFKIVLRDDIWRQLRFENKSHLFGRSVRLEWSDQQSFLKVVLKQALASDGFSALVNEHRQRNPSPNVAPDSDVQLGWRLLVGERMKGGKAAFTRNWVWSRLADANGDHSPRYLLQLFHEALAWERDEELKTPYDKTIVRPRALTQRLPRVSEQAAEAIKEEFAELQELLDLLQRLGRTPVATKELESVKDVLGLGKEAGILSPYEERGDEVVRYKIPDLYRYALGMTRKGQA